MREKFINKYNTFSFPTHSKSLVDVSLCLVATFICVLEHGIEAHLIISFNINIRLVNNDLNGQPY